MSILTHLQISIDVGETRPWARSLHLRVEADNQVYSHKVEISYDDFTSFLDQVLDVAIQSLKAAIDENK
jgi:hypothetical protein